MDPVRRNAGQVPGWTSTTHTAQVWGFCIHDTRGLVFDGAAVMVATEPSSSC